ncbi:fungal-specific transcription factor domain-containing protein [Tricladium varicosporioides]|nr:fungal-specific transcription factor domain-containing protein [Hymenoscyphus varicosporioides]
MSSSTNSSVKAAKKSAFSCEPCRRRKVKCSGEHPTCKRCLARSEACVYKLGPTLSYTQRLEERIAELEAALKHHEHKSSLPHVASDDQFITSSEPSSSGQPFQRQGVGASFEGLKFDKEGSITFHGPTSFFQLPAPNSSENPLPHDPSSAVMIKDKRERLVANAWQQRLLETLAETPEPFQHLLQSHWCWIQPLFNFVYRPAFTRDMEVLGPYYSHMLLNAMLSHSVRWCKSDPDIREQLIPFDNGALFERQAHALLQEDLLQGHSKIPTVQTLLLLSAHESGRGNRTQAWLYSGMAFRLIEDMGINIDSQKYAGSVQLSDEDIEIRRRLFWSCYFYDKMISLYLGRSPSIQHSKVSPPQIMLDDSAENDLWIPHGVSYPDGMTYPPTQAHSISCFVRVCQLSVILNQILVHIYDPYHQNTEVEMESCLEREGHALAIFWDDLPVFLKIDPVELPQYCPPSHIVTLNCLYHTFKILLYRPMLFHQASRAESRRLNAEHLLVCITSATSIIAIFDLFCRSFGDGHCVLAVSYSIYTAASIFLLQVQADASHDQQSIWRLEFCIRSLERIRVSNPVIASALSLIIGKLSNIDPAILTDYLRQQLHVIESDHIPATENESSGLAITTDASCPRLDNLRRSDPFQIPSIDDFNLDQFQISPEILERYAALEPISSTDESFL